MCSKIFDTLASLVQALRSAKITDPIHMATMLIDTFGPSIGHLLQLPPETSLSAVNDVPCDWLT